MRRAAKLPNLKLGRPFRQIFVFACRSLRFPDFDFPLNGFSERSVHRTSLRRPSLRLKYH